MASPPKYSAFISYSRENEAAVQKLYRRLTRYRLPKPLRDKHGATLGRFFLDRHELGAAGELDEELYEKLDETRRLIVCCSPAAAQSKWVNAEAEAFIDKHGRAGLLAVVLDGEPHDAFPPVLLQDEPLAADFRPQGDGEENGFLKLVAGLLYVDLGELRDLQAEAERQRARIRNALVVLFAALAVTASIAAVVAVRASDRARAMTAEAVDIGAGVVGKTDELSRRFGMPTSAIEELLAFADERFTRLFEGGVRSDELQRQQLGLLVDFSRLYARVGDARMQVSTASKALGLLRALPAGQVRSLDYVETLATYGDARLAIGDTERAIEAYTDAIEAARRMLADIPDGPLARNRLAAALTRLGELHMGQGRPKDALPLFEEALTHLRAVAERAPHDRLAAANAMIGLNWVGSAQSLSGDRAAGAARFREAIDRARALLEQAPDHLPTLTALGAAEMKLGQTLSEMGDLDGARTHLAESADAARRLVEADPRDAEAKRNLALRWGLLGSLDMQREKLDDAARSLRAAAELYEQLIQRDPEHVEQRQTYARALAVEAIVQQRLNQPQEVLARRRRAAELWASLIDPARARAAPPLEALATAYELWGDASSKARRLDQMLRAYGRAEPVRRRIRALDDTPAAQRAHASVLYALGLSRKFDEQWAPAAEALREAADLRLGLGTPEGRFGAAQTLQQLALVQGNTDGQAASASFERARQILAELVREFPDNPAYAASLRKTVDVLKMIQAK